MPEITKITICSNCRASFYNGATHFFPNLGKQCQFPTLMNQDNKEDHISKDCIYKNEDCPICPPKEEEWDIELDDHYELDGDAWKLIRKGLIEARQSVLSEVGAEIEKIVPRAIIAGGEPLEENLISKETVVEIIEKLKK